MTVHRVLKASLALLFLFLAWSSATPAGAVNNPDYTSGAPTSVVLTAAPARTTASSAQISQAGQTSAGRTQLAITGSDAMGMTVIGLGLVTTGAMVLVARRRAAATS